MAHSDVKLLLLPDGYKLSLEGKESGLVEFGEPLEWDAPNGKRYLAYVDLPEGADEEADNAESCLDQWVYEVKPLSHVEPEDVGGDEDEDEDEDEDDEDEGDEDEDEESEPDEVESPSADLGYGPEDEDDEEEDEEPIYG